MTKKNFKMIIKTVNQKEKLLDEFIELKTDEYGLTDWDFYYTDSPRNSYAHCIPELKRINIENQSICELTISSLQDIVLHEMAHAIAGLESKHNAEFRKVCKRIGCKGYKANNNYECYELRGKFPHEIR
jgi:hypothetical protein